MDEALSWMTANRLQLDVLGFSSGQHQQQILDRTRSRGYRAGSSGLFYSAPSERSSPHVFPGRVSPLTWNTRRSLLREASPTLVEHWASARSTTYCWWVIRGQYVNPLRHHVVRLLFRRRHATARSYTSSRVFVQRGRHLHSSDPISLTVSSSGLLPAGSNAGVTQSFSVGSVCAVIHRHLTTESFRHTVNYNEQSVNAPL